MFFLLAKKESSFLLYLKRMSRSSGDQQREIEEPEQVIFADGGCIRESGHSAAAFMVRYPSVGPVWRRASSDVAPYPTEAECHGAYYHASTVNVVEAIALVASLRFATRTPGKRTLIVVDSNNVFQWFSPDPRSRKECRNPTIKSLIQRAHSIYVECATYCM